MDRKKILGFAVGPIGAGALSLVSLPIMTWVFSQEAIGQLSMLQVVIQFATLMFCLGLDRSYIREYHESSNKPALFINCIFPGILLCAITCAVLLIFFPKWLATLLYGVSQSSLTLVTVGSIVAAFVLRFLSLILRMQDKGLMFSMSQIAAKLLLLVFAATYALVLVNPDFIYLAVAQFAALTAAMLVFSWNSRRDWIAAVAVRPQLPEMNKLLQYGWPLTLGGVASWALVASDRVFLRSFSSLDELAVYSVSASIASGAAVVTSIFNVMWAPSVYKREAEGASSEYVEQVGKLLTLLVGLVMCFVGGMSWTVEWVLPMSYSKVPLLIPLCVLPPLLYMLSEVTGVGITVQRRTKLAMLVSILAVIVNFSLCFYLVPMYGAAGAAIASAVAFWAFFVIRTIVSTRIWESKFDVSWQFLIFLVLMLSILFVITPDKYSVIAIVGWWLAGSVITIARWAMLRELLHQAVVIFKR